MRLWWFSDLKDKNEQFLFLYKKIYIINELFQELTLSYKLFACRNTYDEESQITE